jgi:hypothetical protein
LTFCCPPHPFVAVQACERCPKSEDVWLEASRMYAKQSRDNAKAVLARGVAQVRSTGGARATGYAKVLCTVLLNEAVDL